MPGPDPGAPRTAEPARAPVRYPTRSVVLPSAGHERRDLTLAAVGTLTVLLLVTNGFSLFLAVPDGVALVLAFAGSLVPAVCYTALVLSLDRHEREPWHTLLGSFGWGALVATLFSGLITSASAPFLSDLAVSSVEAPLVEESLKGVALLGLLVMYRHEFDNVLDGLVYGALIGMGFELTEDVLYLGSAYLEGGAARLGEEWLLRPVLTGLAHAVFTATTGAAVGWARAQYGKGSLRFAVPVLGWALAVLLHAAWNLAGWWLWVRLGENLPAALRLLLQITLLLLPAGLTLGAIARLAHERESAVIREQLGAEVESGVLTRAEYATLSHSASRSRALTEAARAGGRKRRAAQQRFFQAAAELAFLKHHCAHGEAGECVRDGHTEDEYRARLAVARALLCAPPEVRYAIRRKTR